MTKFLGLAVAATLSLLAVAPAFARPPTVMNSPGYDRRLQESRRSPQPAAEPRPDRPPRHRRKHHAVPHHH